MPRTFDPAKRRAIFDRFLLKFTLSTDFAGRGVPGLVAHNTVSTIVYAWLVGLYSEVRPTLTECVAWLASADEGDEPSGGANFRTDDRGLAIWMATGHSDKTVYALAKKRWNAYFDYNDPRRLATKDQTASPREIAKTRRETLSTLNIGAGALGCFLANCIQSGSFADGIQLCEEIGYKGQDDTRKFQNETHFALWYCRQAVAGVTFDYVDPGKRVLKRVLGSWLGHGRSADAARWLKIVLSDSGTTRTPLETILSAYDYLPDVERPAFLRGTPIVG
jgi:hypothetical protein